MNRVRIGCSGWSYDDWRGGLYLNNDWKGYAPANARYLMRGLSNGDSG